MNKLEELLNTIQNLRLAKAEINESYDSQISKLTEKLGILMGDSCIKTEIAMAYWQGSTKVEVKDWNEVMKFVYDNKAFDILQKRISPAQLKARINAGANIKGVTIIEGEKTLIIKGKKDED